MRRGLASLLLGLSLVVASLSWAGFTLSRTVLDPGQSERLANQLLDDESVRTALTTRLADSLEQQVPDEVPVPRSVIEGAAETAIDDPRVESVIRDGFVQAHQNALAGIDEPITIETSVLGEAGRDALVGVNPVLERFIPQVPPIAVELPTTGLAWIGSVKNFVDRYTIIGAFLAAIGALVALLIAKKRSVVFRRVAFWAFGAAAFWLFIGYAIPWLLSQISPTSSAFASALVRVFFDEMMRPAIMMAAFGAVMLVIGLLWPVFERRRGARKLQPRQPVVADLRTSKSETPTKPPLKPNAPRSTRTESQPPALAETNAGWMAKEQVTPARNSTAAALLAVSDAERNSKTSTSAGVATKPNQTKSRDESATDRREPTAVMPTPRLNAEVDSANADGTVAGELAEHEPTSVQPIPEWVAGQGYADDAIGSPFIDTSNAEDIDLSND